MFPFNFVLFYFLVCLVFLFQFYFLAFLLLLLSFSRAYIAPKLKHDGRGLVAYAI